MYKPIYGCRQRSRHVTKVKAGGQSQEKLLTEENRWHLSRLLNKSAVPRRQPGRRGCDTESSAHLGLEGIESKSLSEETRRFGDEGPR